MATELAAPEVVRLLARKERAERAEQQSQFSTSVVPCDNDNRSISTAVLVAATAAVIVADTLCVALSAKLTAPRNVSKCH